MDKHECSCKKRGLVIISSGPKSYDAKVLWNGLFLGFLSSFSISIEVDKPSSIVLKSYGALENSDSDVMKYIKIAISEMKDAGYNVSISYE